MTQETKVLIGIGIASVLIITIGAFAFGGAKSPEKEEQTISADQKKVLVQKDSHKKKAPKEKVVLVEFGDFQCPACGSAYPTVEQIMEEYKDEVSFVFRNYPLPMHKNAETAALAAEAAGAQDKFFEMYEKLYTNQEEWGESDKPMEYLEKYANELKLDMDKFKTDVEKKTYLSKIQKDKTDGNTVGVNATPTFFLNGEHLESGLKYDEFKAKIDDALEASK